MEDRILRHDFVMLLLNSGVSVKSMLPYLGPSFDSIVFYALTDCPRDLARSYDLIRALLEDGIDPNEMIDQHSIHVMLDFCLYTMRNYSAFYHDTRLIKHWDQVIIRRLDAEELHQWEKISILLLKYQANPNLPNRAGETAWGRLEHTNKTQRLEGMESIRATCLQLLHTHSHVSELRQSKRLKPYPDNTRNLGPI
jgi:hypothetical protein